MGCLPTGAARRVGQAQGLKPNAARQTVLCYTRRYSGVAAIAVVLAHAESLFGAGTAGKTVLRSMYSLS